jgi:hypothetical protein
MRTLTALLVLVSQYNQQQWKEVKTITATFDAGYGPAQILLLESAESTGTDGLGEPTHNVDLLILRRGVVVYDYKAKAFVDDALEVRDVTNDGIPEVLFHTGSQGASDAITTEHVVRFVKSSNSFADVAPDTFYQSLNHGFAWQHEGKQTVALVATRVEEKCHYCESAYRYDIYRWNSSTSSFAKDRTFSGVKSYEGATSALKGDLALIQAHLNR